MMIVAKKSIMEQTREMIENFQVENSHKEIDYIRYTPREWAQLDVELNLLGCSIRLDENEHNTLFGFEIRKLDGI